MVLTILNVFMGFVAALLLLGVIGEKDIEKQRNVTAAFTVVVLLIVCLNTIM